MASLHDAALSYAARGWALLPLKKKSKVPAIQGGCKSATSDLDTIKDWWDAHPNDNIGIATGTPSNGLIVLDIDFDNDIGEDGLKTLREWEDEHGELPETVTAITGRKGLHLYYQADTPIACSVNKELGVDIRGEGGYCVAPPSLHPLGTSYEWENDPESTDLALANDLVYEFIGFVQADKTKRKRFVLPENIEQGERNDVLFRYASSLQAQGYDDIYISMALDKVNKDRCDDPLDDDEVDNIVNSVLGRYEKGDASSHNLGSCKCHAGHFRKLNGDGEPTGPLLHNKVAHELISYHRTCIIDGAPAIWRNNRYVPGWDEISRAILDLVDDCKISEQREVRRYIYLMAPHVKASRPQLIAFSNGVLDLDGGFIAQENSMVITNVIPHAYNEKAYDSVTDKFLDDISCGNELVRKNLEEVIGICMYRSNEFGQSPVLIGAGSNGKSTYILAVRNVLGSDNVSSLDINVVGKQFQTGRLLGKLANLGDDISNERLNGDVLAVFKKIVTGEWVYTDVKNGDGFEFKPYCTLLFSCNEFPGLGDSSEGMMRRLFPIPFDAHFEKSDKNYDPRLWEKLTTEQAAEYLIRIGIEGLRRVIAQNGLTPSERTKNLVEDVRNENDSVLQWINEQEKSSVYFDGNVIAACYKDYEKWAEKVNLRPFSRSKFTRKVGLHTGFCSVAERREYMANGETKKKSVRVFRRPTNKILSQK